MYLLDTNALSALVNTGHKNHTRVIDFRNQHVGEEQRLFICVISLAEMQFGLSLYEARTPKPSSADLDEVRRRIRAASSISEPLDVTRHVALEQEKLRAKWGLLVAPKKAAQGKLKSVPPECWSNDWPATTLQITENDIWIAAMALTHDLTLVTCDKDFHKLEQAEVQLRVIYL